MENYQTKIFNSVWHQKPTTDFLQWICYKLTSTEFTNGWLRFFVPKLGTTREKNSQMVGCVFLSQNWAPLVKKIYKCSAAFFCPKIGHHSLKKDFSHFFWPRKKSLFAPELENYQTKIFNSVWHQKPTTDFLQWICYKLTSTEFTNGWLRFFVPKLGTTREKNSQMLGCVFLYKLGTTR